MKVNTLDEGAIRDIGHAFGYYDYGAERGLIDLFPGRDAVASYICGYMRMALLGASGCGKSVTLKCIAGKRGPRRENDRSVQHPHGQMPVLQVKVK